MAKPFCPKCNQPAERVRGILKKEKVYVCRPCDQWTVARSHRWCPSGGGGPSLTKTLRSFAAEVKEKDEAWRAMMTSDIRDPRWNQLS